MADLSSLSLSDLAAALKERCSTPQDLQLIQSKIDLAMEGMCSSEAVAAKAHADIREELKDTKAALFNRAGDSEARFNEGFRAAESKADSMQDKLSGEHAQLDDKIHNVDSNAANYFYQQQAKIQDTKFQLHDNMAKHGVDVERGFQNTQRDVQDSKFQLHDNIVKQGVDIANNFGRVAKDGSDHAAAAVLTSERVGAGLGRDITASAANINNKLNDMSRDAAACCCETQKEIGKVSIGLSHDIHNSQNHIERDIDRSERWIERESRYQFDQARNEARDFRGEVLAAQAQAAKDAALCCCETAGLIRDSKTELEKQAVYNYNLLDKQAVLNQTATIKAICDLEHSMDKQFCALNAKDLQRDLDAKQAALVEAKNEISNLRQTGALIEALSRKDRG